MPLTNRGIFAAVLSLVTVASIAEADPAASGYSCAQVPELKDALTRHARPQKDRDFADSLIKRADNFCREGKEEQARGYIDLAHSRLLPGHKHDAATR